MQKYEDIEDNYPIVALSRESRTTGEGEAIKYAGIKSDSQKVMSDEYQDDEYDDIPKNPAQEEDDSYTQHDEIDSGKVKSDQDIQQDTYHDPMDDEYIDDMGDSSEKYDVGTSSKKKVSIRNDQSEEINRPSLKN